MSILDCGHVNLYTRAVGGTGEAIDIETGFRVCYACSGEAERYYMVKHGRGMLYIANATGAQLRNLNKRAGHCDVTDWPGALRFSAMWRRSHRGGGFGAQRTDVWFEGPDGYEWHGVNRGYNDLLRCKRTARKAGV